MHIGHFDRKLYHFDNNRPFQAKRVSFFMEIWFNLGLELGKMTNIEQRCTVLRFDVGHLVSLFGQT